MDRGLYTIDITSGGIIKKSKDGLLLQSSSVANKISADFEEGKSLISGSYVEFAERKILSQFKNLKKIKSIHRRDFCYSI